MGQHMVYIIYQNLTLFFVSRFEDRVSQLCAMLISPESRITAGRSEMNNANKRLNILYQSILWAPRLLAAHCEFRDEIRPRVSDGDQHARVPSGSIHSSDNFEDFQSKRESNELSTFFFVAADANRTATGAPAIT